ncbi:hypothetical protein DFJ73DRAFT_833709 [Zopfochytrium polystomum]|nr:hypothetical protein DFJ73DRAFT_833709 [Zopfochytrium polystomum]
MRREERLLLLLLLLPRLSRASGVAAAGQVQRLRQPTTTIHPIHLWQRRRRRKRSSLLRVYGRRQRHLRLRRQSRLACKQGKGGGGGSCDRAMKEELRKERAWVSQRERERECVCVCVRVRAATE